MKYSKDLSNIAHMSDPVKISTTSVAHRRDISRTILGLNYEWQMRWCWPISAGQQRASAGNVSGHEPILWTMTGAAWPLVHYWDYWALCCALMWSQWGLWPQIVPQNNSMLYIYNIYRTVSMQRSVWGVRRESKPEENVNESVKDCLCME